MDDDPNWLIATQSDWLKKAKIELLHRDPVDALRDAETLVRFAQRRLEALEKDFQSKDAED